MSVSEPFIPDDLAGQIVYLIDNQDVYLVDAIHRTSDTELTIRLHSGERYAITIRPIPEPPEPPTDPPDHMECVDCRKLTKLPAPYGMCPTCRSYETPLPPPFGDPWADG